MTIYLVVLMGILSQGAYNGARVAVSLYALELGATQVTIGVLAALFAVFPTLVAISVGRFVDRVGPALPLVIGMAGMAVALFLPPLFPGIAMLYIECLVLGLLQLLFTIPIEAGIGGISSEEKRSANYALLTMGWSAANFIGPVIAGFSIDHLGNTQAFIVLSAVLVLPLLIFCLRPGILPKRVKHAGEAKHGSFLELWRVRDLRRVLITGAILNSAQALFVFYFPVYGYSLGLSASAIGIIVGMVAVAAFAIRSVIPALLKKRTEGEILTITMFVTAFGFALVPFVANPYALAAIAFLIGLGIGCCNPLSMSLVYMLSPPPRVGEAMGLLRAAFNVMHIVMPVAFGSVGTAFGFYAVFLSNASVLAVNGFFVRKARLPASNPPQK